MDTENRIMYDSAHGNWKVLHQGKDSGKAFKTSGEAFAHLQFLLKPPPKP
jgi:hypothetical protein